MSAPLPVERQLLANAQDVLAAAAAPFNASCADEARLQFLEVTSASIGGGRRDWLHSASGVVSPLAFPRSLVSQMVAELQSLPMPPALALSALARPEFRTGEQRKTGAYYTDFRLAKYLVSGVNHRHGPIRSILDPACGSGILLAAAVVYLPERLGLDRRKLIAEGICGGDLSADALRGTRLALASLTDDRSLVLLLNERLRQLDSLRAGSRAWQDVAPSGFDLVLANPPWEKLKITRHETLKERGVERHYGESYGTAEPDVGHLRSTLKDYIGVLEPDFQLQGSGEHDLYKLFCELSLQLLAPGGQLGLLLPAGLIRSQGTGQLRRHIVDACSRIAFTVMENRARFFSIDTRFKFLTLHAETMNGRAPRAIELNWTRSDDGGVERIATVTMPRRTLQSVRKDLSLPEVRTTEEWTLFVDLCESGRRLGDPAGCWRPHLVREVDMTRDSKYFSKHKSAGCMPLIEGRMVHQFRYDAKRYVAGTGRKARWDPQPPHVKNGIVPQFYFPRDCLPEAIAHRATASRVGFCDITGQTNERTMLASRIPAGVICGNKVPTVVFQGVPDQRAWGDCWLGIANSFVFDWMLRRIVTTTVNYFLLLDLPMPSLDPESRAGEELAMLVDRLYGGEPGDAWHTAEIRAEIEWRVLKSYGQGSRSLALMLSDFPLLDRAQPPLVGEERSTITRDLSLLRAMEHLDDGSSTECHLLRQRVAQARSLGAQPFVPSHFAE